MKKTVVIIIALVCIAGIFVAGCSQSERKRFTDKHVSEVPYEVVKDSLTGYYGFRSKDGSARIGCVYDSVTPFHECTAAVCRDGRWGCVDARGMQVVPCRFEDLRLLGNGVARVRDRGLYGLLATGTGDTVLNLCYAAITVFNDDFLLLSKDSRHGLMNERLEIVTAEFYDSICPIQDGLMRVAVDGRYGLLDSTGREVLNCMFDRIGPFENERARVKAGAMYGLIDRAGRLVLPCIYTQVKECGGNQAYIVSKLGRVGLTDRDGNRLIPTEYERIEPIGDRLLAVCRDGGCVLYDLNGNPASGQRYDRVRRISNRLACVEAKGKYGLVSLDTGQETSPCVFDRIGSFESGFAPVRNGKWGFVNAEGSLAIPCRYDKVKPFQNGQALVAAAGKWIAIDGTGKEIQPDETGL